jgi:hypothetical protein
MHLKLSLTTVLTISAFAQAAPFRDNAGAAPEGSALVSRQPPPFYYGVSPGAPALLPLQRPVTLTDHGSYLAQFCTVANQNCRINVMGTVYNYGCGSSDPVSIWGMVTKTSE